MASAGQYAEMAREEWIQGGNPVETAPYTEEEVKKFYNGSDPQYPNTDWYEILTRDWAPQQQHNLSVRGGSDRRSEEHTSELQSLMSISYAVFCLKKQTT